MSSPPASPSGDGGSRFSGSPTAGGSGEERDAFLPVADIRRIMRKATPPNAKIDEEAVQERVPEARGDRRKKAKREAMAGDDLLPEMPKQGFQAHPHKNRVELP